MKKVSAEKTQTDGDSMRAEYDFTGGIRGKHHKAMEAGYTITIHQPDGETVVKEVYPALRSLIKLISGKRHPATKRARETEMKK